MKTQRRRDTKLELELRRALHRSGLRFRVDQAPLPGQRSRADVVFRRARVAVFVDGCFWHGCPVHGSTPKANQEWWTAKLAANKDRDAANNRRLAEAAWLSIRIWEHEDIESAARRIAEAVSERICSTAVTPTSTISG